MKYKITTIDKLGKEKTLDYIFSKYELEHMLLDEATVKAMQWQLIKERMEGLHVPPPDLKS